MPRNATRFLLRGAARALGAGRIGPPPGRRRGPVPRAHRCGTGRHPRLDQDREEQGGGDGTVNIDDWTAVMRHLDDTVDIAILARRALRDDDPAGAERWTGEARESLAAAHRLLLADPRANPDAPGPPTVQAGDA